MSQFERDLHEALWRKDPPPGFAGKVLGRAREIDERNEARSAWKWSWRWTTVAAMVVILVGGASVYQEHTRQIQAEKKKEELIFALRVTGSKLRLVEERLAEIQQKTIRLHLQQ